MQQGQAPASRIPLYAPLGLRSDSIEFDSRLYNGFAEKNPEGGDDIWVYKRPGLAPYSSVTPAPGQGVKHWNDKVYAVFGGTLYEDGVSIGTVDPSGFYTFSSTLGATPTLFLKTSTVAYGYDGTTVTQVTSPDYPAVTVPGCAYLDGTMYVGTQTANIYGSEINDIQTWDPLNFLVAQIEPEPAVATSKQLVYAISLKETSTEVFYDAGNASGSPLGPVQGSKLGVGCRAAGSVCRVGDDLAWIGTTTEGDVQVMLMSKVQGQMISTPPVDRLLKPLDFSTCWSWAAKVSGHRFYVVTLPASNLTLAFDITSGAWYIWTDVNGNYLPICASTYDNHGNPILQHATNGKLYIFDAETFLDDADLIPFKLYTPAFDGGLNSQKLCTKIDVIADRAPATSVDISWSDDDFVSFSTPQNISIADEQCWLQDGSTFTRRAYCVAHLDSTALRIKAFDMTLGAGTL